MSGKFFFFLISNKDSLISKERKMSRKFYNGHQVHGYKVVFNFYHARDAKVELVQKGKNH